MESTNIILKNASNGSIIPELNGVLLHSNFNPEKEAQTYISNFTNQLSSKTNVLILGIGYGYHILEAIKIMSKTHKNYNIVVIEPNIELTKLIIKNNIFGDIKISIFSNPDVQNLFQNKSLIHFLSNKPTVIHWTPSFNLNKDFFTKFLSYRASNKIKDIVKLVTDDRLKEYLQSLPSEQSINSYLYSKKESQSTTAEEQLLKIYYEIMNQKLLSGVLNAKSSSHYSN